MKPLKPIHVFRWTNATSYKTYIFDTNANQKHDDNITIIRENIYQDDNIEYALTKIAYYISKTDKELSIPFYAWSKRKPLMFDIERIKWGGYHINPFKSKDRSSDELKEPIVYKFKQGIFNETHVHIVFFSDFKEKNKYYFTDYKTTFPSFSKRELILQDLYKKEIVYGKTQFETYHRIDMYDVLKKPIDLSVLFDTLHTTKHIQLIQLANDNFKILYKLYKKHNLAQRFLSNVFNLDKVRQEACLNIYSVMMNGTYCKVTIDTRGNITLSYILDLRSSINWNDLLHNKNMILKYIQNFAKQKIVLKEKYIKVIVYYTIDNSSFATLSKKIGEYIDIFHVVKLFNEKNKNKIMCIYKRSNNYAKEPVDMNEYIKSRLALGITDKELVIELINLGINESDAEQLVKNEIMAINAMQQNELAQKIKIENTGTMVTIEQYKQGYLIDISNCTSKHELNNLLFWLSKIIENSRKVVTNPAKPKVHASPLQHPHPLPEPHPLQHPHENNHQSSSSKSSSEENNNIGNLDLDLGSDDDFFQGGALGKQKHGYFINLLRQADKDLFSKNYARDKCQASKQPLVLSKQEKEDLDAKGLTKYFDNIIEHGSNPNIRNFYTCPRLWCPDSKIPLDWNDDEPKCPLENEEPMKLFWDKDKTIPRFVKLTHPDENGMHVPCCFKKDIKTTEKKGKKPILGPKPISSNSKSEEKDMKAKDIAEAKDDEKDENYIMNKTAPIPIGRYGIVPESLYKLLLPNVSFVLCSKSLNKMEKCLVRKGINHKTKGKKTTHKDSIIYAISYLLGFHTKAQFIKDIRNKLDLTTFLSLENGNVCKDFLDMHPVLPEKNKKLCKACKQFMNSMNSNKFYDININCDEPSYKLSRLLNVYKSYTKFLDFLSSDDFATDKGVHYLHSLVSTLYSVLLVVWEKQDNAIHILCPYYTSFTDILAGLDLNAKAIMIMKEGDYYEPLELKLRNIDGTKIFPLNAHPNMKQILAECSQINKSIEGNSQVYNNLNILQQFNRTQIYEKSKDVIIKTVIINSNLTIDKFMTANNILLKTEPISISLLSSLISNLNISNIKFYDDIAGMPYNVRVNKNDLRMLLTKTKDMNIEIETGPVKLETDKELYSTIILPKAQYTDANIIHAATNNNNPLFQYIENDEHLSQKWFQLQKMVATKLIKVYDVYDTKLSKMPRKNLIKHLLQYFKNIPEQHKIQIILEEIPLYSIDSIKKWLQDVLLYIKYDYYAAQIRETNTEFLFSQYHVHNSIPRQLLVYHNATPNITTGNTKTGRYTIKTETTTSELPSIFTGTPEKLKSKWTKHKKMVWSQMSLLRRKYTADTIPELFIWLCNLLGFKLNYDDNIKAIANSKLFKIINNEDAMKDILHDPSLYIEYVKQMNKLHGTRKKFKTLQIFWDTYFANSTSDERNEILKNVIEDDKLYVNDLHILSISELLNISFLIIHRAKYGEVQDDVKRGEVEDLVASSTFFPAKSNMMSRPLVILAKEYDKTHSSYYAITEKNKNIYLQLKDSSSSIRLLTDYHMTS